MAHKFNLNVFSYDIDELEDLLSLDKPYSKDHLYQSCDALRQKLFSDEIIKYFPSFDASLLLPSYSGIRPIMNRKDKSMQDFIIQGEKDHRIPNLINLYGIDSPGLTSSLALAQYVRDLLK